jgi:outer membrane protein assembly factor BamE (lipoprotein component of BamABCDE complex)
MNRIIAIIIAFGLLTGCASVGHKIDQNAVQKIEMGKTTKREVISLLGSPDQVTQAANGTVTFMYLYARATAKPATFIPVVGPFVGGANVQNQMFVVMFGPDGIVKNFVSTHGATESSTGVTTGSKPESADVEQNKRQ